MGDIELVTPDRLEYTFYPNSTGYIRFKVRAPNDAHIALSTASAECDPMYEIFIGGWGNQKSIIRKNRTKPDKAEVPTPNILNPGEFRTFWIRWDNNTISAGCENNTQPFISWVDHEHIPIRYVGVCTGWGASGSWIIHQGGAPLSGFGGSAPPYGGGAGGYGAQPLNAPGGYGAPQGQQFGGAGGFGAPQGQQFGGSGGFSAPQGQQFGGTGGYGGQPAPNQFGGAGGFGAPQAPGGFGAPQAPGGFGAPQAPGGFGGAPGGFGGSPAPGGFGAPQAPGGFGGQPGGYGGAGGFGGGNNWVSSSSGNIPPRAFVGGEDRGEPLYVVRCNFQGGLIPGKLVPSHRTAYVPWGGVENGVAQYEVLCDCTGRWMQCNGGNIPPNAVSGGRSEDGEPLFVGRVHHQGSITVGKVQRSHGCCYIPFGGQELSFQQYEILVS